MEDLYKGDFLRFLIPGIDQPQSGVDAFALKALAGDFFNLDHAGFY
ncbi:MAG: hypothetical protein H6562_12495 [Lewinellaceae bacterium]|nr:hypothetical protein [Lewinellaceae bacterium]